jgi:hypothetical protein
MELHLDHHHHYHHPLLFKSIQLLLLLVTWWSPTTNTTIAMSLVATSQHEHNQHHHQPQQPDKYLSKIRRAAGSKSLEQLKEAIATSGWTPSMLNSVGHEDGKTALHMAAWKGCIENVQYLVEVMECDINLYSKGKYLYGKTAIFFATTQCRVDVVDYLLKEGNSHRKPAKVSIVNNKGQSIRSIASSHDMTQEIIHRIARLEAMEDENAVLLAYEDPDTIDRDGWWNFRATHSDQLEYGDLDPRFLDRPLRPTDVVTDHAVNPTTRVSRRGSFARRNPVVVREWQRQRKETCEKASTRISRKAKQKTVKGTKYERSISPESQFHVETEWKYLWDQLKEHLVGDQSYLQSDKRIYCFVILLRIVHLGDQLRRSWLSETALLLRDLIVFDSHVKDHEKSRNTIESLFNDARLIATNPREVTLLDKIRDKIFVGEIENSIKFETTSSGRYSGVSQDKLIHSFDSEEWEIASFLVQHLSMTLLEPREDEAGSILRLPQPPVFVNTVEAINEIQNDVSCHCGLVAIDTEWYDITCSDDQKVKTAVSTIQLSYCQKDGEEKSSQSVIKTFVVDLMVSNLEYMARAQNFIRWIFESERLLVMGFALGHDIRLLQCFADNGIGVPTTKLPPPTTWSCQRLLDLQVLFARDQICGKIHQLPGLKACAAKFSPLPLCKEEQCSTWQLRPLRKSQVEYAGLDAAILLVLLAEHHRMRYNTELE